MSNTDPPTTHHESPALIAAMIGRALRRASTDAMFQRGKTCDGSGALQVLPKEHGESPASHDQVTGGNTDETEVSIHESDVDAEGAPRSAQELPGGSALG